MGKTVNKTDPNEARRFVTPEFRASYLHVFKAHKIKETDTPKFSVTMLFKKTQDLSSIKLAMKHAKIDEYGPSPTDWPKALENPVRDGDAPEFAGKEEYKGCWVIKAWCGEDYRPGIVGPDNQEILDASEFVSGHYARAQVFCRCWEYGNKRGVHFLLDCVQKTRDGKPFTTRKSASEVFGPIAAASAAEEPASEESETF